MWSFSRSILKILHRTESFYTGTACGACDKYEVWACVFAEMENSFITPCRSSGEAQLSPEVLGHVTFHASWFHSETATGFPLNF